MRAVFSIFFVLVFVSYSYCQRKCEPNKAETALPKNPEVGKCYVLNFDYNSNNHWLEKDCDSLKTNSENGFYEIRGKKAADIKKKQIKFKKYQEYLIDLGYDLEFTCKVDRATVNAHHKYLKDKKKAVKQEAKKLRKARKDSIKRLKLQHKHSQKAL